MMILLFSILQFKKWFVFLEQWFFANKDSHVCCFCFFDIVSTKEKNVGLGYFFNDFFFKVHERLFDGFFFFNYGWARQIGTKTNWKKK